MAALGQLEGQLEGLLANLPSIVMIWDGGWADPPAIGGPQALDPIQTGVLQTVLSAPPVCQSEIVRGPRLIVVGDEHDSTVLAFGSGEWRWGDLAEDKARPQSVQTINR